MVKVNVRKPKKLNVGAHHLGVNNIGFGVTTCILETLRVHKRSCE